ncbi:MAG: hypothetical protein ACYC35_20400 [Pirellulales bacterium]
MSFGHASAAPPTAADEARIAAAGIHKVQGKHITLYTDVALRREIDELPEVFDQAYPQWCAYFGISAEKQPGWHMTAYLVKDKRPFQATGLMPASLPMFSHGFSTARELWFFDQSSDYYRRHLLLHEGTHGFMDSRVGGAGPPWYMEGMAELLATHRWRDGKLVLGYFPASREEVPMLGRIKIVQDAFAERRAMTFKRITEYGPHAHLENEPYGWCWAAAAFLDGHPRYRDRFRQTPKLLRQGNFSERFQQMFARDWGELAEEWQVFVADLEHGYDFSRTAIDFTPGRPLSATWAKVTVAADRGWQASGLRLEAGVKYRLRAAGRYQVANQPRVWWCEPGGVSIRYYKGRPLGMLLATVRPDVPAPAVPNAFLKPLAVGLGTTLTPTQSGTLYLRINDSSGELADNAGTLVVEVKAD